MILPWRSCADMESVPNRKKWGKHLACQIFSAIRFIFSKRKLEAYATSQAGISGRLASWKLTPLLANCIKMHSAPGALVTPYSIFAVWCVYIKGCLLTLSLKRQQAFFPMYAEKHHEPLPLDMLLGGEEARIVEVTGAPSKVHQLAEMGLHRDCRVQMIRPGQPCVLSLEGRRFSLRLDPDICVLVRPFMKPPA